MGDGAAGPGRTRTGTRPLVVAHRGGAGLAPENTLAAVRRALNAGVDAVELDVRLSRDGHPVVIHDATVDRTMAGTGRVADLPLTALQALRARGGEGEGVPALREALDVARGRARVFVEVKTDAGEPHRAIEAKVLGTVRDAGAELAVTFLSFDLLCLRRLRELGGGALLGLLVGWGFVRAHGRAAADRLLEEARGLGVERISLYYELATPELQGAAQGAGIAADVWTVNEGPAMRRFARQGADGIVTDRPDVLLQVLADFPADATGA